MSTKQCFAATAYAVATRRVATRTLASCLITACLAAASLAQPAAPTASAVPSFSADQQAARQKVLDSKQWQQARYEMNEWLSVQTAYNEQQVAALKADLQVKVDGMSASQLQEFLFAMEQKIKVLTSPEMNKARSWVKQYYTPQAQEKIAKRVGIQDPVHMTALQLTEALERFESQRASRRDAQAAFNRSREQSVTAQRAQQQERARASERARDRAVRSTNRSSSPYTSPYAPQSNVRRYTPADGGARYSIGPWGGVWRSSR